MNHEPECTAHETLNTEKCWECRITRAAYQRGRRDAAVAVAEIVDYHGGDDVLIYRPWAVAAARGNGEQK